MFVYTTLEESYAEHQRLLEIEKAFLDKLELAYQVIDTAAGDLGLSAIRKFDCEAWIPTQGKYRELTSTSNCTEFQTRRLDIRGRFARAGSSRSPPSTARCAPRPAPSSRSSRPTSRPTARCGCPKALQPWLGAARSWSRSPREQLDDEAGSPQLVALDIDGTLLKWVDGAGTTHEEISPAVHAAVHRALDAGRARRARQRPLAARHDRRRRPARPVRRAARPALDRRVQRRGRLPLPAARGRPRGEVRRPPGGRGDPRPAPDARWSRSRSAASATGSTRTSRRASSPAT